MVVTLIPTAGNSSKFHVVVAKRGEFIVALSYTLRTKIWKIKDETSELAAAKELAEAIVSRHDPKLPFKEKYIFAEHNTEPTLEATIHYVRRNQI